jgi:hypothetical protein
MHVEYTDRCAYVSHQQREMAKLPYRYGGHYYNNSFTAGKWLLPCETCRVRSSDAAIIACLRITPRLNSAWPAALVSARCVARRSSLAVLAPNPSTILTASTFLLNPPTPSSSFCPEGFVLRDSVVHSCRELRGWRAGESLHLNAVRWLHF